MEITMLKELKQLNNLLEKKQIKKFNSLLRTIDSDKLFKELPKKREEICNIDFKERSQEAYNLLNIIDNVYDFALEGKFAYSIELPENDISKWFREENGINIPYYSESFHSFDKLRAKRKFENSLKKGYIYACTYKSKDKTEGEILLNHIKLEKFINQQEYSSGLIQMKYIETCGIKEGLVNIGLYVPFEWEYTYYKFKGASKNYHAAFLEDKATDSVETYSSEEAWIELAQKITKDFNLENVLCKIPSQEETFKISNTNKETVGIISTIDDLNNYLGEYDYFGFTYFQNMIHAMSLGGHILIR